MAETWKNTRVGVYFGPAGEEVDDPYFGGEGPRRTGCVRCGQCMIGCRYGAKNTLRKNYLWFAERLGVRIQPERTVTDIRPLGAGDGSEGYEITTERVGRLVAQAAPQRCGPARSCSPRARSAPTSCCATASTAARCRGSPTGWASSSAPTASR